MIFRELYEKIEVVQLDMFLFGAEDEAVRRADAFGKVLSAYSDIDFGSSQEIPAHLALAFEPLWELHLQNIAAAESAVSKKATVH